MQAVAFDTYQFIQTLRNVGFEEKQAEGISSAFKTATNESELATKRDIERLESGTKRDIERLEAATSQNIERLAASTSQKFEQLDANGLQTGWRNALVKAFVVRDVRAACTAKHCVKVWRRGRFGQTLQVKAGQQVTIRAKVKGERAQLSRRENRR